MSDFTFVSCARIPRGPVLTAEIGQVEAVVSVDAGRLKEIASGVDPATVERMIYRTGSDT